MRDTDPMELSMVRTMREVKRIENRIIEKHLDIILIKALEKEPLSGYGVISLVHREYGVLVGSGRVYNLLRSMEKKRIVKAIQVRKGKYYILDTKGQEMLEIITRNRKRMIKTVLTVF
jgi:DNA-binding PadR family transcriptional regulator